MKRAKILLIAVVVLCLVWATFFVKGRITAKKGLQMVEMPQEVEQKILSFDLVNYGEDGTKKWLLKGDSADILAEIVNLSNINMETYDDPQIFLTALEGIYDRHQKEITLFTNVEAITSDGTKLNTEYLKWHGKTDTITSDHPVRIERSDMIADGNGALAMPQMKRIILDKDVKVRLAKEMIKTEDEETQEDKGERPEPVKTVKTVITCDGPLDINYEKDIAIFNDNVLVEDKKGKIYSDKMEAFLDPVTKDIVKVVAEGEVKVVRAKDSTYSQKVIYTTADQKIVLIGRPKIYIHATEEVEKMESKFEGIR